MTKKGAKCLLDTEKDGSASRAFNDTNAGAF